MRNLVLLCLLLSPIFCNAQNTEYDPELAKELGADDYGMKSYIFVILKTGPAEITNQDTLDMLFKGHFDNIGKMVEAGQMVVAGPYLENDRKYRGLFILDIPTMEEAEALMQNDPTIARGIFEVEMTPWYGSAALPKYLDFHKRIEKSSP